MTPLPRDTSARPHSNCGLTNNTSHPPATHHLEQDSSHQSQRNERQISHRGVQLTQVPGADMAQVGVLHHNHTTSRRIRSWSWPWPTSRATTSAAPPCSRQSVNPPVEAPASSTRAPTHRGRTPRMHRQAFRHRGRRSVVAHLPVRADRPDRPYVRTSPPHCPKPGPARPRRVPAPPSATGRVPVSPSRHPACGARHSRYRGTFDEPALHQIPEVLRHHCDGNRQGRCVADGDSREHQTRTTCPSSGPAHRRCSVGPPPPRRHPHRCRGVASISSAMGPSGFPATTAALPDAASTAANSAPVPGWMRPAAGNVGRSCVANSRVPARTAAATRSNWAKSNSRVRPTTTASNRSGSASPGLVHGHAARNDRCAVGPESLDQSGRPQHQDPLPRLHQRAHGVGGGDHLHSTGKSEGHQFLRPGDARRRGVVGANSTLSPRSSNSATASADPSIGSLPRHITPSRSTTQFVMNQNRTPTPDDPERGML